MIFFHNSVWCSIIFKPVKKPEQFSKFMKKELQILLKTDLERQLFWDLNCNICRWRQARELPLVRACWQTSSTVYWTKALQRHQGLQKQVRNICEHQKSRVMSLFPCYPITCYCTLALNYFHPDLLWIPIYDGINWMMKFYLIW